MNALLEITGLKVHFPVHSGLLQRATGHVRAVDGITFTVERGSCTGLVGESGSGKSTTGKAVIGLAPVTSGSIRYDGTELAGLGRPGLLPFRRRLQMVFQDPYNSLNPRHRVETILAEPQEIHFPERDRAERRLQSAALLERVGLEPAMLSRHPHEFSGGQRQRIGIARALAVEPEFLILDEPVSALDVSVQAQIINLLDDLRRDLNLTFLFISHDLAVVEHFCDRIVVMERGVIREQGPAAEVLGRPQHPYTQKLLAAVPAL
jgi:oligopeptide transport system ATP-binding protein